VKQWYWHKGLGWRFRFTGRRAPRRLTREVEEQERQYAEQCRAEDREAAKRLEEQGRRKLEAWQMPDDFFRG
jgi:hypothetical protein